MSYTPINWNEDTPITASLLDRMDTGINENDDDLATIQGGEAEVDGRISTNEGRISTNEDDIASNEGRISTNENDIDVIETVSGTVRVSGESSEQITHNLGSENVVVTVAVEYDDYFATFLETGFTDTAFGYSITDSNNIRIHNGFGSPRTYRYTVTRAG